MSHKPLVLAVDIGTSSARVIAYDETARPVTAARAQRQYTLTTNPPGAATLDADLLVDAVAECIDSVLDRLGSAAGRIAAVGCCAFWHSMVGVDSAGKAITPLYTWADTRSAEFASRLKQDVREDEVHRRTGCAIHPNYFPTRLRWLAETDPSVFRRVERWISPGEYLYQQVFGRVSCSVSMASATGLFDQNGCRWDSEMLAVSGIAAARLGDLTDIHQPESGLLPEWSYRWPALSGIPWVPAIGDGASGNVGSGCVAPDSAAINLGTSGAIRLIRSADSVDIPPELWCYRLNRHSFVLGAAFSDGGEVYSWMRRTLQITGTDQEIDSRLLARTPDSHGLSFLPFLAGERSIGWRPDARASIHGIRLSTDALDILQASMEGVALRFGIVWDIMRKYFPNLERVVASGGAIAESRAWQIYLSNALGSDILVAADAEASSRGAAALALKAAGIIRSETELPPVTGQTVEFDPQAHEILNRAARRQQDLYFRLQ